MTYCITDENDDDALADPADVATRYELVGTERALAAQRAKSAPEQVQYSDGTWPTTVCVDCYGGIEPVRLEQGRVRCYTCQSSLESRRSRGLA